MDQDLIKASPEDQHAYLMETDKAYSQAKPEDRAGYLKFLGVQTTPGLEKLGGLPPAAGARPKLDMPVSQPNNDLAGKFQGQVNQARDTAANDWEGVKGMVKSIPGAVAHPFDTMDKFLTNTADKSYENAREAKNFFQKGNYGDAAKNAVSAIPFVGPPMAEMGSDIAHGDLGKAGVRGAEMYLAGKTPEAIGGGIGKVMSPIKTLTKNDPLILGLRWSGLDNPHTLDRIPGVKTEHLHAGLSDIKTHGGGASTIEDVLKAAPKANQANRNAWEQWLGTVGDMPVHGNSIVKATEDSLSKTLNPRLKQRILDETKAVFDKPHTATELEALLKEKNGELAPFYAKSDEVKNSAAQAGARTGRSQALLEAQVDEIRNLLYNHLDPSNGGIGPRELQQRYGAVKQLENAANAKRTEALASKPASKLGGLGKQIAAIVDAPGKVFHGDTEGALSKFQNATGGTVDPLVHRAINAADDAMDFPLPGVIRGQPVVPLPVSAPPTYSQSMIGAQNPLPPMIPNTAFQLGSKYNLKKP